VGEWLTAREIAAVLPFGERWVRRHLKSLGFRLNARDLRWRKGDVNEWLTSHGLPKLG
jgi:predicted DNA-binding transcriptional regulator AlpA